MYANRLCSVIVLAIGLAAAAAAGEPEIRLIGDASKPSAVEVVGLDVSQVAALADLQADDPRWSERLALYVIDGAANASTTPILGSYVAGKDSLRLTPRYALRPGMRYRVV